MKSKVQNLTQAASVLLLSTIAVKLIGAFFKIPLSADFALGDLGFGYFSAAYDIYMPIYTLAIAGFPVAIARMVADYTAKQRFSDADRIFYTAMKALLSFGVAGAALISLIAMIFVDDEGWKYSLLAIAPSVFFCAVASVYRGYFEGLKNMVPTAISGIIEALGKLILGLGVAIIVMQITHNSALAAAGAMAGITLGTWCSVGYLAIIHKKKNLVFVNNSDNEDEVGGKAILAQLIKLCVPVAIASLSVNFTSLIDTFTLRQQLTALIEADGNNANILLQGTLYTNMVQDEIPTVLYGIKGKAHTLFSLIPTLTTAFGIGALPLVTDNFVRGDYKELNSNANMSLKYSSIISLPAGLGYICMAEKIMELLYGDTSSALGGKILLIYGIAAIFAGLSVPLTALLQAVGKQTAALVNIVLGIILKILCNIFLTQIKEINVYGAVIGTALCFAVIFMLHVFTLVKGVGITIDLKNVFIMPLIAALICGLVAFTVGKILDFKIGTLISIALAGAVYLLFLFIFRIISVNEVKSFFKK